ncbi:MAG: DUF1206 domain-containing protein [Micrococcales bacterium]|nr:DUF1206 domain-containing protein [Micrococcales bacterium]
MTPTSAQAARKVGDHPAMETAARVGFAASGLLHLLIGWIALQLAWGGGGRSADQSGAMGALASTPLGKALLWVAVIGLVALGLLSLTRAAAGSGDEGAERLKDAGKGIVYLAIAWPAAVFASGGSTSSKGQTTDATAGLMAAPMGRLLVGVLGLAVLGVGGYHIVKGLRRGFLDDLRGHPGKAAEWAGVIGYAAKGVALGVLGLLFVRAAMRSNAAEAGGLDSALRTLLEQPFGRVLLTLVALGFVAYAVYSAFRARLARL